MKINFSKKAQLLLGFLLLIYSCSDLKETRLSGFTMGTTYEVIISDTITKKEQAEYQVDIDTILANINQQMSIYIADSEISQFNRMDSTDSISVSSDFATVLNKSLYWASQSNGMFDISILPLVNAWGFGIEKFNNRVPIQKNIDDLLPYISWEFISLNGQILKKLFSEVKIDLGAVAKGYAVDRIGEYLKTNSISNYYIEIGGEILCQGLNPDGNIWTIGIENPIRNSDSKQFLNTIHLNNRAIATSGDYRNYFEWDGDYYSHTIHPKTGYPVDNGIASVTVTAPTCMDADAIATALMVMPFQTGKEWIKSINLIEALWVIRKDEGTFESFNTSHFFNN